MGVPKFFRYTSERYACLNELVKQYQIPDFDNMYLDMNGIIHNCSHPDDSNPHFRITEEKIFEDIFHYLSILFQIIKPKKLFFMAIDGVAPRAKMNQQRGRRFRSAREAEKLEEDAKSKGEVLPTEERFDSNCITPGTVFMARLHEQLRYFVKQKISTDSLWSKVKVVLSGHETPGEGEHKIMDYIRWARSQPDYDPDTRHCLYGLDADLIMLGMCSHEPHFALLREEVKFGKINQRSTSPEDTNFYLLHLSLLRQYLEQEFISIKHSLPFKYDIEKIVDDWVLMGFLVGNDFIPNLPNMHISNDSLPLLYATYMKVLPTLDGYINEAGDLNLARFEKFMAELAKIDREQFQDTYADLKYFVGKTGRRPNEKERKEYKPNDDDTFNVNIDDIKANKPDDELQALINATHDMFVDDIDGGDDDYEDIDSSDEEATFNMEFLLHKKDYYMNKLDYSKVTDEVLASQAECYVRAIQWNLHYYYRGCVSWCWYYPHHYAPYISDIKGFKHLDLQFELGEPFKPFEQLLAVLPAASKHLLPTPYHELMTDEESPIVNYYPVNFKTDLNGKKNDWEAVVLIPFIDEKNLLAAMGPCFQRLTDEERQRNSHGPMSVFSWTAESQGTAFAPEYFPPITDCRAAEKRVFRNELDVPPSQLKRGMLPGVKRDIMFPGFPTMRHLKYTTSIQKCKVKVFDNPSRNENMIIQIVRDVNEDPPLDAVAQDMLGKIVWVGWPHLTKAKVISVSNEKQRLHLADTAGNVNGPLYNVETNAGNLHKQWISERSTIIEHNMSRLGIELGDIRTIIHAVNLKGYKYMIQDNTQMVLEPEWCTVPCGYAYQAVVPNVKTYTADVACKFSTPQEAYPPGETVFLLTQGQYYGCEAKVVDSSSIRSGRIKVSVVECREPLATPAAAAAAPYKTAHHAAAACGISTQLLSRLTGCVFVVPGQRNDQPTEQLHKINIGLNLKFNKRNQEVTGYTRRCPLTNTWLYSARCVALLGDYVRQFPELIDRLYVSTGNDVFFESELWPDEMGKDKPKEISEWIKSQPHSKAARRECGSEALEPEELKQLASSLDKQLEDIRQEEKRVTLHVKWNLLYKPDLHEGNIAPDAKADFKLYDRVVCVAKNITVPLGAKATITAVYRTGATNTVRLSDKLNVEASYQLLFDEAFPGGTKEELFDVARFYRMLPSNMLNISYGRKLRAAPAPAAAAAAAAAAQASSWRGEARGARDAHSAQAQNLLHRDGHHSAFASYSPTKDRHTPVVDNRDPAPQKISIQQHPRAVNQQATVVNHQTKVANHQPKPSKHQTPVQDSSSELLKSLLKISQNDTDSKKQSKAAPEQSWRSKTDNAPPSASPQQRQQQQNWRIEAVPNNNQPRTQPPVPTEWSSRSYQEQPPMPPIPNFSKPFHGPGPAQVPFPQFAQPQQYRQPDPRGNQRQNRPGNQPGHGNQDPRGSQGPNYGNQGPNYGNPDPRGSQGPNYGNQGPNYGNQDPRGSQGPNYGNPDPRGSQGPNYGNPDPRGSQGPNYGNQDPRGSQGPKYGNQDPRGSHGNHGQRPVVNGQPFPLLPNMGQGVVLAPAGYKVQNNSVPEAFNHRAQNNSEKANNPFVPLQVQASRRRQQGPAHSKPPPPPPLAPAAPSAATPAADVQHTSQDNSKPTKPQRKKKPRIAANLPFHAD